MNAPETDKIAPDQVAPEQERAPSRRRLFAAGLRWKLAGWLLLAAIIGFAAWFFGLDAAHAIGLGAVVLAAASGLTLLGDQAAVDWPPDPILPRDGARREVSQLGWALHSRGGGVAPEAVRRLRSVTAQTLELHGLDLDAPGDAAEIARILGGDTVRLLRRGSAESPKPATFDAIVSRLSTLADAPIGPLDAAATAIPSTRSPSVRTPSTGSPSPRTPPDLIHPEEHRP